MRQGWVTRISVAAAGVVALTLLTGSSRQPAAVAAARRSRPGLEERDAQGRVVYSRSRGRVTYDESVAAATLNATRRPGARASRPPRTRYATSAFDGLSLTIEWIRAPLGSGIGLTGLFAADLDQDGTAEIVAGGGGIGFGTNERWYILSRQGTGYDAQWTSLPYPSGVSAVRVAQMDADSPLEVLVASGPSVFVHDGSSYSLERTLTMPADFGEARGLEVADVDADGARELVTSGSTDLYILDVATGVLEWQGYGVGGLDLAVGQIDGDAGLEIVVANGMSSGHVFDGQTHVGQWSAAFGDMVRVADLDGDGLGEVVAGFDWDDMIVYEGDTHAVRYTVPISDLGSVRAADTDGNGTLELLYGDGQWGEVHVLNGSTGAELWAVDNPEHGTTDIAVGDVDGDGVREVLWGAGHTSSGPDYLYVADSATHGIEWQSLDISGPFYGLDHGDVDGDLAGEILYAAVTSDSGYGDGLYFVHDAATKALEYVSPSPTGLDWTGLWRIRMADVDADPQREILFTTSHLYTGILVGQDGLTHAEQWRVSTPDGLSFRSLQLADLDGDGTLEAVAGMQREHTGAPGLHVDVYDAATGALEWRSPSFTTDFASLSLLRLADVDADPGLEIVAATAGGGLRVLDPVRQSVQLTTPNLGITSLDTPDRDGDGIAEIVIGSASGTIQVLDAATGDVTETLGSYGGQIDGLAFTELSSASGPVHPVILFVVDGCLSVADATDGQLVLSTDFLGASAGAQDSLVVGDVDADQEPEVFLNAGTGVLLIELRPRTYVTAPTVTLTAPAPGAEVTGSVTLQASASDDWGVDRVEFYVDGTLVGTDREGPYRNVWNATASGAGPHVLEARAYDASGNEGRSPAVTVTVTPPTGTDPAVKRARADASAPAARLPAPAPPPTMRQVVAPLRRD